MGDLYASGGSSGYPSALDTATTQTNASNPSFDTTSTHASKANNVASAIINVETALGTNPRFRGSIGQTSQNNSGTPNTQFDLDAETVILASASGTQVRVDPGAAITNNISTAGPAANGRDQAGAFSASSWIHFYWIWNGTTLATLSSAVAPPTGPTLPTGYTHWSYAGAVRYNATPVLEPVRIYGDTAWYETGFSTYRALSAGSATTETSVSVANFIPPNALAGWYQIFAQGTDAAANVRSDFKVRWVTAKDEIVEVLTTQAANITFSTFGEFKLPNLSQNLFYLWTTASITTRGGYIDVMGYQLPNGGA